MKQCQFCAEEIKDEAIKCKHCGSDVSGTMFRNDSKNVAQGIKKVEFDRNVYNIGVFFSMVAGALVGIVVATASHSDKAGWISGFAVMMILGSVCYNKYLKQ